jgi:spore coat protein CotF
MDVKNFYLNTPMDQPEYMQILVKHIPDEIMMEYNLHELVHEGYIYTRIEKGMYGLPQAGILANK